MVCLFKEAISANPAGNNNPIPIGAIVALQVVFAPNSKSLQATDSKFGGNF